MKVERVREKDGKLEISVELDGDEVKKEMTSIASVEIQKNKYDINSSKADNPIDFLRERLGADEASFVFDEGIMRHRVPFALTAAGVDAIGKPVYKCLEHALENHSFTYHLVCVPVPEFTLSDYGPVSVTLPSYKIKESEVDEEMQKIAEASATPVTNEEREVVERGDKVEIAMDTTMYGKKVDVLCADKREYNTGAQQMPDDFDNAIIGMKVGETKTFNFEGPQMELDSKGHPVMDTYECTVKLLRIIDMKPAEMDDAWARTVQPGVHNLKELRDSVREKVRKRHESEHARQAQLLVGNELAKRLEGDIPDLVYAVAIKEARDQLEQKLKDENITLDDYLKQQKVEKEQLDKMLLVQVRSQLTRQFALNAYAKYKKLDLEDKDLEDFFESISPGKARQAQNDFRRDGRMYAARCAALRLKAAKLAVEEADVKTQGESEPADDGASN